VAWRRGRKGVAQQVVLPSLDRLSGLIERVVELVDAVGDANDVPAPEPVAEPPQDAPAAAASAPAGWVAFVSSAHGYRLVEGVAEVPVQGATIELEGVPYRVSRLGPSPLPGDPRRCVYVEGEEPRAEGRTSDA
jgi:hypothetical protein